MKINEFTISDLFRAGTGDWPGDAAMAKELAKNCTKATPGEILKMIKQAKEQRRRGQAIDLVSLCGDKLDPQVAKKLELQKKFTPDQIAQNREKQDILRRQRKHQRKEKKKQKPATQPPVSSQPRIPPRGAQLLTKSYGTMVWDGTMWTGGGLRITKPEDIQRFNQLYFEYADADRRSRGG